MQAYLSQVNRSKGLRCDILRHDCRVVPFAIRLILFIDAIHSRTQTNLDVIWWERLDSNQLRFYVSDLQSGAHPPSEQLSHVLSIYICLTFVNNMEHRVGIEPTR